MKRRGKRKIKNSSLSTHNPNKTIFPLLLAAAFSNCEPNNAQSLIKKCLKNILLRLSLQQTLNPLPIFSLLPVFLISRCTEIACLSAEIVGAASLLSLEMNEQIASDHAILKALISALGSANSRLSWVACNAVLDLSTTFVARQRLLHFSAIHKLMFAFLQVPLSPATLLSFHIEDNKSVACARIAFKEDEHAVSLLNAAITLINSCTIDQLQKIPKKLSQTFLILLKRLWEKVHNQMVLGNTLSLGREDDVYLSNISINNLAETIFRLSINGSQFEIPLSSMIKTRIFGWSDPDFGTFMSHHWEASPILVRNPFGSLTSSFTQSLNCKESYPTFLSSMLQSFVSCVPIASDELNILSYLEDMRNQLGCPIIYQQDIRVLRTDKQSKKEVHFFLDSSDQCCIKPSNVFSVADVMKCEDAFKEGYTIALRGMEFRFASVAAIADAMASLFGQPSVGANMYLTPLNSQGLACHCDDHCVFVFQLFGTKQWTTFPQSDCQLPRLYDPFDKEHVCKIENSSAACEKFLLREGDVLYIPRGCPHEACTNSGGPSDSARFSLHLTFGVEVEAPFDWEGFAHVALHCWSQTHKEAHHACSANLNFMSVNILHATIDLLGAADSTFRKACLVAAVTLPLDTNDWLYMSQKRFFKYVIDKISSGSSALEVFRRMEVAIEENEDPFQRMSWLSVLIPDGENIGFDWNIPSIGIKNLFLMYTQEKDAAEAVFNQVKSKFCAEVLFEDVIISYKAVLEKYKMARKQYMNGMLSLHGN